MSKKISLKIFLAAILAMLIALAIYLVAWPVPFKPIAWYPAPIPNDEVYAENGKLAKANLMQTDAGPEAIAVDNDGNIYTGLNNGRIMQYTPNGTATELTNTNGRPLGLKFDKFGNLIIADAQRGLLIYYTKDARLVVLADEYDGVPIKFADDVDIAPNNIVWFSDASQLYALDQNNSEFFDQRPSGRLIAYTPATGSLAIALDDLGFANGVALAKDGSFILVNETMRYRIRRLWLKGPRANTSDIFIDNLPGFPNNITRAPDGGFWVALVAPRTKLFDGLASQPFWRKVLWRASRIFGDATPPTKAQAIKINANGIPVKSLDDTSGKLNAMTSVLEKNGKLYLGQLNAKSIGILNLP